MEIKSGTFNFPPGTGERTARLSFVFSQPITEAHVALSGYRAEYIKADRQIQRLVVRLSTEIGGRMEEGWIATVLARFNMRDQNEDHPFSGAIDFVLFAEVQDFAPTPLVPAALEGPDQRGAQIVFPTPEMVETAESDDVEAEADQAEAEHLEADNEEADDAGADDAEAEEGAESEDDVESDDDTESETEEEGE